MGLYKGTMPLLMCPSFMVAQSSPWCYPHGIDPAGVPSLCSWCFNLGIPSRAFFQQYLGITKAEGEVFEALTILAGLGWSEGLSEEPRRWEGS